MLAVGLVAEDFPRQVVGNFVGLPRRAVACRSMPPKVLRHAAACHGSADGMPRKGEIMYRKKASGWEPRTSMSAVIHGEEMHLSFNEPSHK